MAAQDDVQKLITEHQRRWQKFRERQAKQGISTPPEVLIEIEDIEARSTGSAGSLKRSRPNGARLKPI